MSASASASAFIILYVEAECKHPFIALTVFMMKFVAPYPIFTYDLHTYTELDALQKR